MDVNEEIIKEWLHLCKKQFTIENICFKIVGPKGGSNYSDIDLLATDGKGNFYDYEVKWRSVYSVGATDKETIGAYINQMTRRERLKKIQEIIGDKPVKRIFITTKVHFGKSLKKRQSIEQEFRLANIKIMYFDDIIKELTSFVSTLGRYNSPILQTIRILRLFDE